MYNVDEQDRRIAAILGTEDIPGVDDKTLALYRDYLNANLELPCQLTGIEDFPWEERYVLGPGSKAEYERLKKTHPSYTDKYELIHINEIDEDTGVLAAVRRLIRQERVYTTTGRPENDR